MRAVMLPGDRKVVHAEFPDPRPGPGQVLIQIKASGLCGSELHGIYQRDPSASTCLDGKIPGHEPSGVVVEIGDGVTAVKPGDRVLVYHIAGCGDCKFCRMGWMINCTTNKRSYGWDANGGHAEYMVAEAVNCIHLPEPLTFADGAHIACGGGTAYQALCRLQLSGRDRFAIFGLGPVGLGALIEAKAMGATVYAVDLVQERVDLASELGADVAMNGSDVDPLKVIADLSHGEGVEAAADFSGSGAGRNSALDACGVFGRVAWVGEGNLTTVEPSPQILHKQLTVIGSWVCGLWQMEELAGFMVRKGISFEPMISHRFSLDEIDEGLRLFDTGRTGKIVIEP